MDLKNEPAKIYGDVCIRKQRRKRQKLLIIELFLDYAKNSTLHGLRYIAERGLSALEKTFWLLTFSISCGICAFLIRNVWIKWKTSPVIVTFSEHVVPVGQVPFPSVTICPQLKSMRSKYNFLDEYAKPPNSTSNESIEKLENVALVCDYRGIDANPNRTYSNSSIIKNLFEVAPTVNDVFRGCKWRNSYPSCDELFKPVLTSEGVCYNFNSLAANEIFHNDQIQQDYSYLEASSPSKNWTISNGYTISDMDVYPHRGRVNGASPDLEVILAEMPKERDGICNILNKGFKIYVQNPSDMPQASLYYYAALPKQVSSLAIKFNMLTTADSLENYDSEVRQCYFSSDRPLRYFKIYTPNNCQLECQSNYTFERCGCVWFHMPHGDSRNICTIQSTECKDQAQEKLAVDDIKAEQDMNAHTCRCLPNCRSVYYDAEILKTEFNIETYIKNIGKIRNYTDSELEGDEFSKIEMYFKEPRFVSMHRSELFGLTDFMANCGGLLGLFLGFSFLSIVEMFYFITLRLFYTLKRDLKEEKAKGKR